MTGKLRDFYKGKRVLVTGHTGFKGSWLLCWLNKLGAQVKGYALPPDTDQSLFEAVKHSFAFEDVQDNILNKERLLQEVASFQPDVIFHMAAQALVRRSYEIPSETFAVNITGTAHLLEAVIHLQKKCTVVVITSDKVYENKETLHLYNEEDTLGGFDPYSASKAATELVVNSFRNSFFPRDKYSLHQKAVISARAGNVIGGGDRSKDRIVPDIIAALSAGQAIRVRNPAAIRPWQHVLEPLSGYLLLALLSHTDYLSYSSAYNFGPLPEDHLSVQQLVEKAISVWGEGGWETTGNNTEPHEAGLLRLDISRAKKELHWMPRLNSETALQWTMDWYRQEYSNAAGFTIEQINNYEELIQ